MYGYTSTKAIEEENIELGQMFISSLSLFLLKSATSASDSVSSDDAVSEALDMSGRSGLWSSGGHDAVSSQVDG